MPKSAKKSASKVDSTLAAVAKATKATKNGKRDAAEIIEKKVASGKKQKIVNGGAANAVEKKKNKKKKNKKQESSASESEEEEKEEEPTKNDEADSDDGDSSDEEDAMNASDEEPAKQEAVEEKAKSDDSEEDDDDGSEEEDEPKTTEKKPQTSATPQATGSKTLFVGNLSFKVEEEDIIEFFKEAGEVAEVRLSMKDGRFAGYGHVEFATPDAAQKALKLNGESLCDRAVKLDLAKERGAYTPGNSNDRSSQKSGQSEVKTVFVKGFGTDDGFDSVRSTLEEHFGKCGEITRISIPKDFETDGPKGIAYIDFSDSKAFSKALELTGSEVSGGTILVEEAQARGGGGGGGRGRGGRGGGRGRFGGRDGGRGRFGGRDGGRGRGRGRRGRGF